MIALTLPETAQGSEGHAAIGGKMESEKFLCHRLQRAASSSSSCGELAKRKHYEWASGGLPQKEALGRKMPVIQPELFIFESQLQATVHGSFCRLSFPACLGRLASAPQVRGPRSTSGRTTILGEETTVALRSEAGHCPVNLLTAAAIADRAVTRDSRSILN
jgi:hypothetical protein